MHMYIHTYIYIHICIYTIYTLHMHICIYIYIYIYTYTYIYLYIYQYTYIYIYTYVYIYIHMYIYIYIHVYIYLSTYIYDIRMNIQVPYRASCRSAPWQVYIRIHNITIYIYTHTIYTSVDLPIPPGPHSTHLLVVTSLLSNQSRMPLSSVDRRWKPFGAQTLYTSISCLSPPPPRSQDLCCVAVCLTARFDATCPSCPGWTSTKFSRFKLSTLPSWSRTTRSLPPSTSRSIVPSWPLYWGDLLNPSTRTRITPCSLASLLTAPFQRCPPTLSWRQAQAYQEVTVSLIPSAVGGRSRGDSSSQAHLRALLLAPLLETRQISLPQFFVVASLRVR